MPYSFSEAPNRRGMRAMDLLPQLLLQATGAAGSILLDRTQPTWSYTIGADPAGQGGVTITPGAVAAAVAGVALALGGSKIPGRAVLANLTSGALVYETAKLAERHVLPLLEEYMAPATPQLVPTNGHPHMAFPGAVTGLPYARNPARHVMDYELYNNMAAFANRAA